MSHNRLDTRSSQQGRVVKAAALFPAHYYHDRATKENPLYQSIHDLPCIQINQGEPCFTDVNVWTPDERVPVFAALNGIGFDVNDYQNLAPGTHDAYLKQLKLMYKRFRFVGLAQKDVPAASLATMVDGPVLQKAGEATFTWRHKQEVYEGTWLVYKFPDPKIPRRALGYGDDGGRIVADLVPINDQEFFPSIESMRVMQNARTNQGITSDPTNPQDQLLDALQGFCAALGHRDLNAVLSNQTQANALNALLAALKVNTCEMLDRIVGRVSRGASMGGQCDIIVSAAPH